MRVPLARPRVLVPLAAAIAVAGGGVAYAAGDPTSAIHHHGRDRLAGLGRVVHGEVVVQGKDGAERTVEVQRGAVTALSPTSLTVKSTDGFTATYALASTTKVRIDGKSSTAADLKTGATVFVTATVDGSTATATHVVERAAASTAS